MLCPVDTDVELVMSERQGVEIDYCPKCRGVWLDRGELDKILDRAAPDAAPAAPAAPAATVPAAAAPPRYAEPRYADPRYDRGRDERGRDDHRDDRGRDDRSYGDKKKRKGSWLGDILDF
ncbi:zf-TFIIB domain-containing protein [Pengzhenrongella frigida]|uniref:Transcription factor zinc-finger domain-containing protein n=1 Tax=Pengzhenrongella frigida TaxID=1259133 RepID=A0A4Q5N534_9MICO|nr:zf-TFIIB domain-containing protein [Cellulomonas sp. HLT2-17]RYV51857.1 hypothetical protein EUA98_06365 [Cellulomonas sp. HLT2-17]